MRVIGTWKNRLDHAESVRLAQRLAGWLEARSLGVDVSICPPMIALAATQDILAGIVEVGSQNVVWDADNAFTGETSARALKALRCDFVMIGHSERRVYLGETDALIASKVATALDHQLAPLVCVGETYDERKAKRTVAVLEQQLGGLIPRLKELTDPSAVMIAYEPAWAITTSSDKLPANPELAADDHLWIRGFLEDNLPDTGTDIPIIYGAGVNTTNVADFLAVENVDGVLVGGASQEFSSFIELISVADEVKAG